MESIWTKNKEIPTYPSLDENILTDTIVIGGGMCGILTAFMLSMEGHEVVLFEKDRIFSGQSGRTTAKLTLQHGCIYNELIQKMGQKKAREYAEANSFAIKEFMDLADSLKIDCGMTLKSSYIYSVCEKTRMYEEYRACLSLGLDCEFKTDTELPFDISGAVEMKNQACFNPVEFICGLLKNIPSNLKIFENTNVISVKDYTLECISHINNEQKTFTAASKQIVFCTNFPFINSYGMYFARMHRERSYVLALEGDTKINDMYIGISPETNHDNHDKELPKYANLSFRSCRIQGDEILLLGGEGHRTGYNTDGGRYSKLKNIADELFPSSKITCMWSAQDCITPDKIPYIGRYSQNAPDGWYCATGFMKWGMSSSMLAAKIINDIINRKKIIYPLFDTSRFSIQDIGGVAKEGKVAIKGIAKENLTISRDNIDSIPIGNGKIINADGIDVGVYRESNSQYYTVDSACPHMGCRLEWNQDELSWDCPCHGSRFDYKGNLLDNPAQSNI